MPFRNYSVKQKYVNKHGDVHVYPKIIKKWIKSRTPYKRQERGSKREPIMTRFGLLDGYNRKQQQELICPSGYSIGQCFNVLRKLWYAYRRAKAADNDPIRMKKYAKAIQDVQKDMGIKTASFPDLELYGDLFVRNDKNGQRIVFESHSDLKNEQEEYEKWMAENSKFIRRKLQKPNKEKGEDLVVFADDTSPADVNHPYILQEGEPVPILVKPDFEKGQGILIRPDTIPFRTAHTRRRNRIGRMPDEVFPYKVKDHEVTVPLLQKPNKEKGEDLVVFADDTSPADVNHPYILQEGEPVPILVKPDFEKGQGILIRPDTIPFRTAHRRRRNRIGDSTLLIPDDEDSGEEFEAEIEDTVPPIEPEGDKVLVFADDIPFRS